MKQKIILLFISCMFTINKINSQIDCVILSSRSMGDIPDAVNYVPNVNTPIKYLRVNVHFMLLEQGTPGFPGNFTSSDDGNGNSNYTGYNYANDLINMANYRLSLNHAMNLPPNNNTVILPRQYRYVLNGVFFHNDNSFYYFPNDPLNYSINVGEVINIFLDHSCIGCTGQGHAVMTGNRYVTISGTWEGYINNNPSLALWINAQTLNHEIGHNLSLFHTVRANSGPCFNQEDYCSDTPYRQDIIDTYEYDPCCGWNTESIWYCSNNMMDYSGDDAITPLQLGRIHWTIENEMHQYKTCYYTNNSANITSFTDNMAIIAKNVQIPIESNIVIDNHRGLFVNTENFEINGEFEVQLNSEFWVTPVPSCNE